MLTILIKDVNTKSFSNFQLKADSIVFNIPKNRIEFHVQGNAIYYVGISNSYDPKKDTLALLGITTYVDIDE